MDCVRTLAHRFFGNDLTEDSFWELLFRHRCYGLQREVPCPEAQKKRQRLNASLNANNILTRYRCCAPLFDALQKERIPYAVHKGAVLSQVLYKNPFVRKSGDVDLLVCRDDADRVKQLLCAEGFVQGRITSEGILPFTRQELLYHAVNTHQLAPFVKKTENPLCPYINVDVNTEILWGESEEKTDMTIILSEAQSFSVCEVSLQKLSAEREFIALCLHHYKDMNSLYLLSKGGLRLGLFCELYDYLHKVALDPKGLLDLCDALSVAPYVKRCIADLICVFGEDPIMDRLHDSFSCVSLSDTFGLGKNELRPWGIPLPQRIFEDIPAFLETFLSAEEKEKIQLNSQMME